MGNGAIISALRRRRVKYAGLGYSLPAEENAMIWIVKCTGVTEELDNGVIAESLGPDSGEYIAFQFCAHRTGSYGIKFICSLDDDESGDVELRLDYNVIGVGDDPEKSATSNDPFVVSDLLQTASLIDKSSSSELIIPSVDYADSVYCKLVRTSGGNDTNQARLRIFDIISER